MESTVYAQPEGKEEALAANELTTGADAGRMEGEVGDKIKPSNLHSIDALPVGSKAKITAKMDDITIRSLSRENGAAEVIAKNGYNIEQNLKVEGTTKKTDFLIEGEVFDCYAPIENTNIRSIASSIAYKVEKKQTNRVVLNLDDWSGDEADIIKQLKDYSIKGLEEVIVVKNGRVISIYP